MPKKILTFGILFVVLVGVLTPNVVYGAACTPEQLATGKYETRILTSGMGAAVTCVEKATQKSTDTENSSDDGLAGWIWKKFAQGIGYVLITISSLALLLSGWIFDEVVKFTIIDMAKNLGGDPGGVGDAITKSWSVLRDIANMAFIFVLLYAAFKAMFDTNFDNFQTTIKNIIIVALLINFSLFFSKVVIDASNIVAVGFYSSITGNTTTYNTNTTNGSSFEKTISAGYMNMLGLQTFFGANILDNVKLDGSQILTVGILTAVFMLITAVVLLIAGIMFVARFVILIFLMILSPLALIAYIIPGQSGKFKEWWDALIAQSFFAPLYFALTWVVFKVGTSLIGVLGKEPGVEWSEITTNPSGVMPLIINYVLIIGFSIAALVISKSMASKTPGFKQVSGGLGAVAIGGTALAGRKLIGGTSSLISEKYRDKWSQSAGGRAGLWLANKGSKASFDVRSLGDTKLAKKIGADKHLNEAMDIAGKAGGKGGFRQAEEDKAKEKAKYAKEVYGQTDAEKEEAEKLKDKYEKGENKKNFDEAVENEKKEVTEAERKVAEEKKKAEEDLKTKKEAQKKADPLNPVARDAARKAVEEAETKLKAAETTHNEAITRKKSIIEDKRYSDATKKLEELAEVDKKAWEDIKNAAVNRQEEYAKRLENSVAGKITDTIAGTIAGGLVGGPIGAIVGGIGEFASSSLENRKTAARAVRKQLKEKSKAEKAADANREYQKELDDQEKASGTSSTTTPTPAPATPPPTPTPSP